jgi:hypothetical protein
VTGITNNQEHTESLVGSGLKNDVGESLKVESGSTHAPSKLRRARSREILHSVDSVQNDRPCSSANCEAMP